MARYVIDARTLVHVVGRQVSVHARHQLVAPIRIRSEALELLLRAVRQGDLAEQAALAAHERMTRLRIRVLGDRVSRAVAWRLARDHGWEDLRDAEYLAVTRLQADALVRRRRGARGKGGRHRPVAAVPALTAS